MLDPREVSPHAQQRLQRERELDVKESALLETNAVENVNFVRKKRFGLDARHTFELETKCEQSGNFGSSLPYGSERTAMQ